MPPPSAFGRAAASPQTRQMRCWPSSERTTNPSPSSERTTNPSPSSEWTTNPSSRRKRQDSLSLLLVLFPPKPLLWVSAGALLGEVIKNSRFAFFSAFLHGGGITTLGVRFMLLKRWTPAGHGGVFAVFMLPRNLPRAGRTPTLSGYFPLRGAPSAHGGSHGQTRSVFAA